MDYIKDMLEFNKITDKLKGFALTDKAKERFDEMEMILNEGELHAKLTDTTEARKLLDKHGTPPLGTVNKIAEIVEAADRGELLSIDDLEKMRLFAALSERIIRYLKNCEGTDTNLSKFGNGIHKLQDIRDEIERCIRAGMVDDYATKELKNIRRKIEHANNNIRAKLESLLQSKKEYFSESFISKRNGRFTLPVKKEHKLAVSGSVMDMSSSGATYFIEPAAVAKMREELEILLIEENNEVRKVLYYLASLICHDKQEILLNIDYMEELDYIFAKGKLSVEIDGIEPTINTEGTIRIVNGRHPLIDKKVCVPLDINFGKGIKGIVITGPNTGGKTVAIKTVGLSSVMAGCGLHIAASEADICMSATVLCDIGDGQSITENLSTFSAHIRNIINILKAANSESLVLMDELGSGTDPAEGMGIAISVLEELKKTGCNFLVTTHYPQVKEYAAQTEGIINARMAFDKESLRPLYRLELGEAGESCALYIAKKLGMSGAMLKRAYEAAYYTTDITNNDITKEDITKSDITKRDRTGNTATRNDTASNDNFLHTIINETVMVEEKSESRTEAETKRIIKQAPKEKPANSKAVEKFHKGDSVMIYPQKKIGIVYETANEIGEVGVQLQKKKILVNYKRLQIKALAKDMYPDDYDFSIVFDSVAIRKARHQMDRKYVEGLEINYQENEYQNKN